MNMNELVIDTNTEKQNKSPKQVEPKDMKGEGQVEKPKSNNTPEMTMKAPAPKPQGKDNSQKDSSGKFTSNNGQMVNGTSINSGIGFNGSVNIGYPSSYSNPQQQDQENSKENSKGSSASQGMNLAAQ